MSVQILGPPDPDIKVAGRPGCTVGRQRVRADDEKLSARL